MTTVGLAEYVESSKDYWFQFVYKHEDSNPEKVSLTYLAIFFFNQKQVQIEGVSHEAKTAMTTAPTIAKKKRQKKNIRWHNKGV